MAALSTKANTITQIIYLNILPNKHLDQRSTHAGDQWAKALDIITESPGYKKLYWGRRLEEPEKVQLHIVWDNVQHSTSFKSSPQYKNQFLPIVKELGRGGGDDDENASDPRIRHATLRHQALDDPFGPSLLGYPIGTAVYLGTDAAWHEGAWPLWTHVVRHVDGCRGIVGGRVLEPVEQDQGLEWKDGYLVYVAWQSVKHHEEYHRTEHFAKHHVILNIGVEGWAEYGHVVFEELREERKGAVSHL